MSAILKLIPSVWICEITLHWAWNKFKKGKSIYLISLSLGFHHQAKKVNKGKTRSSLKGKVNLSSGTEVSLRENATLQVWVDGLKPAVSVYGLIAWNNPKPLVWVSCLLICEVNSGHLATQNDMLLVTPVVACGQSVNYGCNLRLLSYQMCVWITFLIKWQVSFEYKKCKKMKMTFACRQMSQFWADYTVTLNLKGTFIQHFQHFDPVIISNYNFTLEKSWKLLRNYKHVK